MVEDTTVRPVLTEWLSVVAPHLNLDSCILSVVATIHASRLASNTSLPTVLYVVLVSWDQFVQPRNTLIILVHIVQQCLPKDWRCWPTCWWSLACPW